MDIVITYKSPNIIDPNIDVYCNSDRIDYNERCMYDALITHCVGCTVTESFVQRLEEVINGLSECRASRYISGDSMSSLLWFWHVDNILLPNLARW
jgi:hypothetical protein